MKKNKLRERVEEHMNETGRALQLLWDNINPGQRKQLAKKAEIKALLERYGVEDE
ncbi:MAG: hypothetical protein KBS46_06890 [Clostridiales bacterium]|nr:hypothetical protein [Candidatus Apopatocola equi]